MTNRNAPPLWIWWDGEPLRMETCVGPAPFTGYLAFRGGACGAGFHLLFQDEREIGVTGALVHADDGYTHVWLEFEGIPQAVCLEDQAYAIHTALMVSKKCSIIARSAGRDDRSYEIPVCIKLFKKTSDKRALEVSNGSRIEDVSRPISNRTHSVDR